MILIVPLDGTEPARAAIPVARTLAQVEGATLHVLHVAASAIPPAQLLTELGLTGEETRGAVVAALTGVPNEVILAHAAAATGSMIVMCMHTSADRPGVLLGSVARAVVQSQSSPVVLVPPSRGQRPWALQQILLPHDGLPTTAAVLRHASELADRARAELAVLHVATATAVGEGLPGTLAGPRYVDQPQHEWPSWAQEFVQRARAVGAIRESVRMRLFFAFGETAPTIAEFAANQDTDLVVVPTFAGSGPALAGTTLEQVLIKVPCPVLVLPVDDLPGIEG
ncbi:MAG: universal stress protein [Vicinamibacterales bacterium]